MTKLKGLPNRLEPGSLKLEQFQGRGDKSEGSKSGIETDTGVFNQITREHYCSSAQMASWERKISRRTPVLRTTTLSLTAVDRIGSSGERS